MSTTILGIASGAIGCLAYWKRQNLMSDALSHAALPGVVITFLIVQEKNLLLLIIGAGISAFLGAMLIQWISNASRISEDAAMGMVLAIFYGLGIMLLTVANRSAGGNQSGLDSFIFGQAAAMVKSDVRIMSILAIVVIFIIVIGFKEWKLYLFDRHFANGLGLPIGFMNGLYTLVLVMTIVIGIQAVGVILMAAMLIIPAVSSRYWTKSFRNMLIISSSFGAISGAVGTFISSKGSGWPTGPFIVVIAAGIFILSLTLGKEKGLLIKFLNKQQQKKQQTLRTEIREVK